MSYTRKLSFIDNNNKRFKIKIETDMGYFAITSQSGQGQFNAKNQAQQDLLDFWDGFHLKKLESLKEDFFTRVDAVCDKILEFEEMDKKTFIDKDLQTLDSSGEPIVFLDENRQEADIEEYFNDKFYNGKIDKIIAIAVLFHLPLENIEDLIVHESDNRWTIEGEEYLFGTDDEMDVEWDDYLQNYLDDCVLQDLPENMKRYFDEDAWKSDARDDGRGHSLNRYDGRELSITYQGEDYYAYQQG